MCNVLPEKSGIVLTSRELDENYTAMHQFCQGIDGFQTEEELRAEIERDVWELKMENKI
jgi:hypothetical protein